MNHRELGVRYEAAVELLLTGEGDARDRLAAAFEGLGTDAIWGYPGGMPRAQGDLEAALVSPGAK